MQGLARNSFFLYGLSTWQCSSLQTTSCKKVVCHKLGREIGERAQPSPTHSGLHRGRLLTTVRSSYPRMQPGLLRLLLLLLFFLQFQNIHSGCQPELQNIRALLGCGGLGGERRAWECYGTCFFAL